MEKKELNISISALILANTLPLIGVFFWGWQITHILALYWLENVIIGLVTMAKLAFIGSKGKLASEMKHPAASAVITVLIMCGFAMHYGLFTLFHGMFLAMIFFEDAPGTLVAVGLPALGILLSHIVSLIVNFIRKKEYIGKSILSASQQPYKRIGIMHVFIILGSFIILRVGSQMGLLLLLIGLKVGVDIRAHLKERNG